MRPKRSRLSAVLIVAAILAGCSRAPDSDPRMVSEWMNLLYGAVRVERLSPPVASRLLGYATTALYSGLASTNTAMPSLVGALNGLDALPQPDPESSYDPTLTAVAAERVVLDSLLTEALPTTRAAVARLADSLEAARIASGVATAVAARSAVHGRAIGLAVIAWSRTDGFDSTRGRRYTSPIGPGLWANDAPGPTYASQSMSGASEFVMFDNPANILRAGNAGDRGLILSRPKRAGLAALPPVNMAGTSEPYWGQVRPFVLRSWNECPVPEPPVYATDSGSAFYKAARQVYDTRTHLTPEERAIALYWADNAGESGTPVGHWIAIASQMISQRRLSAEDAARLVVLTAVAQADAFIASWGFKYKYNVMRPRPYIRGVIDSTWEPLIPSPPFPEYPSAHSTQSSAAATAMTSFIGGGAFDDSTGLAIGHAVRRFDSFTAAAVEAGISRIYGGIHYPFANIAGRTLGRCVGSLAAERLQTSRAS